MVKKKKKNSIGNRPPKEGGEETKIQKRRRREERTAVQIQAVAIKPDERRVRPPGQETSSRDEEVSYTRRGHLKLN